MAVAGPHMYSKLTFVEVLMATYIHYNLSVVIEIIFRTMISCLYTCTCNVQVFPFVCSFWKLYIMPLYSVGPKVRAVDSQDANLGVCD